MAVAVDRLTNLGEDRVMTNAVVASLPPCHAAAAQHDALTGIVASDDKPVTYPPLTVDQGLGPSRVPAPVADEVRDSSVLLLTAFG